MPAPSTFKRFVEVGRVVLIKAGPEEGKIAVIVEIIDHSRAIIDGPITGVPRQSFPYRHLVLTPLVVKKLPRATRTGTVRKFMEMEHIVEKWNKTSWATKLAMVKRRRGLNDFERFNIRVMKQERKRRAVLALGKAKKAEAAAKEA